MERKIRRSGPSYLGNQWNVGEFDPTRIPLQWNPASPQPPAPTFYAPAVPPTPQSVPPSSFYPPPQLHSHTQMPNLPSVGSISTSTATFDSSNYLLHQNTTPSSILGPRTFGQFEDDEIEVDPSNPTPPFRYAVEKNNEEVKDGRSLDHQSQSAQSSSGSSLKHSSQTPTTNPDIEKSAFRSYPTTDTAGQIFDHLQTSNQMFFPQIPYAHQPPPPPAPPSITCPPLYVTAQLPHLVSYPIFSQLQLSLPLPLLMLSFSRFPILAQIIPSFPLQAPLVPFRHVNFFPCLTTILSSANRIFRHIRVCWKVIRWTITTSLPTAVARAVVHKI